jgi:hypothetical protein
MTTSIVGPKLHPEETPNTPLPIRGRCFGENQVFGLVIPNLEVIRESGLIIPETSECQNIPHVFTLLQVSDCIDHKKYPLLAEYQQKHGTDLFIGPQFLYKENMGYEWTFPEAGCTWVQIDAKMLLRPFEPFNTDLSRIGDRGQAMYARYEKMLDDVRWYIKNVQERDAA